MAEISLIRKRGRPSKLVESVRSRLLEAIGAGSYYDDACAYAGVSYDAFNGWMNRGRDGDGEPYIQFFQAVKKAEADAVVRMMAQWQSQMPGNWQAIATFLERRYPEKWGRRVQEVIGKGGGPVQHEMKAIILTPQDVAEAFRILRDAGIPIDGNSDTAPDDPVAVLPSQTHP